MHIDPLLQHRLTSLRLVGLPLATATDVVDWLVAVQAQNDAGPLRDGRWLFFTRSSAELTTT